MPQRVRQFSVQPIVEDFIPVHDHGSFREDDTSEAADPEKREEGDLPSFMRNRSLRRRLDSAFDSCYESNVAGWLRSIFGNRP